MPQTKPLNWILSLMMINTLVIMFLFNLFFNYSFKTNFKKIFFKHHSYKWKW